MKINLHKIINLQESAKKLVKNREYKKAIKKYKQLLEKYIDPEIHLKIVECYLELSKNDKNKEYYLNIAYHITEAMVLDNNLRRNPKILIDLSYAYIYLGYLKQSRELLEELLDLEDITLEELELAIGLMGYIEYSKYKNITL